jgi:PAS domain S-box-containing protein
VIDRDDNFFYANQAFAKIHGFENLSELQQLDHASDLLAEEDRQRLGEYRTDRLAGRPVPEKYQYRVRHRDGSLIWLNNTYRAITWQGQPAVQ